MFADDDFFANMVDGKPYTLYVDDVEVSYYGSYDLPYTIRIETFSGYSFTIAEGGYDPVEGDNVRFNTTDPTNVFRDFDGSTGDFDYTQWTFGTQTSAPPEPVFDLNINQIFLDDLGDVNGSLYVNNSLVVLGDGFNFPYVVKLVVNDGFKYSLSQGGYDPNTGDNATFDMTDPTSITNTFNSSTGTFDPYYWTFQTQEVVAPEPVFDLTITQVFIDDLVSKRITAKINDVLISVDDTFNYPYSVEMFVDESLIFTSYDGSYDVDTGDFKKFNISTNNKTINKTFIDGGDKLQDYTFQTDIDETITVPDKVSYNDVFVVTDLQARELATTQFTYVTSDESTTIEKPQGNNVLSFINLPFIIPNDLIIGSKTIKIGVIDTGISAEYLNIDSYELDLGNITIPETKNNFLDYANKTAILHLPYTNPIALEIDYVIGQTISISYNVNLYDGVASVNIYSSKIDGVIDTKSIKLNINIPFGKPDDNPSNNAPSNIEFGIDNGVKIPYIELLTYDAILENGFFTIPVIDEGLLSLQNGFVKIDNVELKTTASRNEKEMIVNMLTDGVIIK